MNDNTLQDALGFIFDVDGTLIDSHESHYRAWDRIAREHGKPHEKSDIVRHFGKTTPDIATALLGELDRDALTSISERKARYFIQEIPASQVIPGAIPLLRAIKNMDKGICLASSNFNFVIKEVIKVFQLDEFIDGFVGLDDITRGKPDPEMIIKSANRLALSLAKCIMVGDSIYDVQAGNAAGCKSIGVCTGIFSKEDLERAGALMVLDDVSLLLPLVSSQG